MAVAYAAWGGLGIVTTANAAASAQPHLLFAKPLDLPIDTNLNPNLTLAGIPERWSSIPESFVPEEVLVRKISDVYYVVIGVRESLTPSFRSGDVLALENCRFIHATTLDTYTADVSGQYPVIGDIEYRTINGRELGLLSFVVDSIVFKNLYDSLDTGTANDYRLTRENFTQPLSIRYNTGVSVELTNVNPTGKTFAERYLLAVRPFKNIA